MPVNTDKGSKEYKKPYKVVDEGQKEYHVYADGTKYLVLEPATPLTGGPNDPGANTGSHSGTFEVVNGPPSTITSTASGSGGGTGDGNVIGSTSDGSSGGGVVVSGLPVTPPGPAPPPAPPAAPAPTPSADTSVPATSATLTPDQIAQELQLARQLQAEAHSGGVSLDQAEQALQTYQQIQGQTASGIGPTPDQTAQEQQGDPALAGLAGGSPDTSSTDSGATGTPQDDSLATATPGAGLTPDQVNADLLIAQQLEAEATSGVVSQAVADQALQTAQAIRDQVAQGIAPTSDQVTEEQQLGQAIANLPSNDGGDTPTGQLVQVVLSPDNQFVTSVDGVISGGGDGTTPSPPDNQLPPGSVLISDPPPPGGVLNGTPASGDVNTSTPDPLPPSTITTQPAEGGDTQTTPIQPGPPGTIVTPTNGQPFTGDGMTITSNGSGSDTISEGALSLTTNPDGSTNLTNGAINITTHGGTSNTGQVNVTNNADGSENITAGPVTITTSSDGSTHISDGPLSITTNANGSESIITDGRLHIIADATGATSGSFPTTSSFNFPTIPTTSPTTADTGGATVGSFETIAQNLATAAQGWAAGATAGIPQDPAAGAVAASPNLPAPQTQTNPLDNSGVTMPKTN